MNKLVSTLLKYRPLMLVALGAWLVAGIFFLKKLDIEAYPDPSPPLVEIITQNPSWSAEEMEQQVTVPVETALNGVPHLQYIRSISIFGLSDVKMYFDFDSDYFTDRQEVLNRLQLVTLPAGLQPQLSPWSPIGEIYRFRIEGPKSLNELKAIADWLVRREVKQVPGVIDVTVFGGTTRQYQAEVDPNKLLQYNLTLPQVVTAVQNANANVGGGYISLGSQAVNVRGIGLLRSVDEMGNIVVAERNGAPVYLKDLATVHEGYQQRLGKVGMNNDNDIVLGIVLLQKGEQSMPALRGLHEKIHELNNGLLPAGVKIKTVYDRTDLIHITTDTVRHLIFTGIALVLLLLLVFLGDLRTAIIAALTIPFAILFAFGMMVLTGHSANLISIGAIDFGIIVDAAVVVVEHIYRGLQDRQPEYPSFDVIAHATAESARPVLFSTLVILVAFLPLFTMEGVPGKIFEPMSVTYGFALTGALIFALLFAPVLTTWGADRIALKQNGEIRVVRVLRVLYRKSLNAVLSHRRLTLLFAFGLLILAMALSPLIGGEFMPKLEEGNLWVRATLPTDVSFEFSSNFADDVRSIFKSFPEVTNVVSQVGRPDDGTDVVTFNNAEFLVQLKPQNQWPRGVSKDELIQQMSKKLSKYPGVDFGFSQNIQDNVEEAMSGVKGENSLKLFGDDFDKLSDTAGKIKDIMQQVPGIADLGVFRVTGQPNLLISINRTAAARYGLAAADINSAVQAAIGGITSTEILDGDRRFDFVVRYKPEFRQDPDAIRNILIATPDGSRIPLSQVADINFHDGAFMIYRENNRRYIPIKFSVRGRDLASTMEDAQNRISHQLQLPEGFHYEWAGEYDSLKKEQRRLLIVIPISLAISLVLLYVAFDAMRDALIVLGILPFGAIGGLLALLITGTPFSVSAAVGFASALGVGTLGALVFLSAIRRLQRGGHPVTEAIRNGAMLEMRPVMMACLAAGLGLLPAAVSHGIGAQAQQPLARVVVGAMITTLGAILFVIPVLASYFSGRMESPDLSAEPEHEPAYEGSD
jgi:heavy metal efflux system protein